MSTDMSRLLYSGKMNRGNLSKDRSWELIKKKKRHFQKLEWANELGQTLRSPVPG